MVVPEHPLKSRREMAEFLGWSLYAVDKHMPDFKRAGIIFTDLQGRIPHRKYIIYTFPSLLIQWLMDNKKVKLSNRKSLKSRPSNRRF